MGVLVAHDPRRQVAVLFDDTSMVGFGPVFQGSDAGDQAEHFVQSVGVDLRTLGSVELAGRYDRWRDAYVSESGHLSDEGWEELSS